MQVFNDICNSVLLVTGISVLTYLYFYDRAVASGVKPRWSRGFRMLLLRAAVYFIALGVLMIAFRFL